MKPRPIKDVVILEDDAFLANAIADVVGELGGTPYPVNSVGKAEKLLPKLKPSHVITDLALPLGKAELISPRQAHAGHGAGKAFIRLAKKTWKNTNYILTTGHPSQTVSEWCQENDVSYQIKPVSRAFWQTYFGKRKKKAFVIHGRNMTDVATIKKILKDNNIEPVVLMEQPSKGLTVIEKFEKVSADCDLAIVALSSDDAGKLNKSNQKAKIRARQNVIYELGYFHAALRRQSGRVIIVNFGVSDIPSDLAGIIWIDGNKDYKIFSSEFKHELG